MVTENTSNIRVPRRAESTRIALALAIMGRHGNPGHIETTCTSVDELSPTFSIRGVRYDGPVEALRELGKCVPVGFDRLYPKDNEAACKVDYIVGITDAFLKDYMAATMEKPWPEKRQVVEALDRAFETLLRAIYPGTPQAEGDCFCVGRQVTIADLQVYAVFAILDTIVVTGFQSVFFPSNARTRAAIDHCRKIASHEMIQSGKLYYLDNGSDI